MDTTNDRILTDEDIREAKELQSTLAGLNRYQKQRVIGFAACLKTLQADTVRKPSEPPPAA